MGGKGISNVASHVLQGYLVFWAKRQTIHDYHNMSNKQKVSGNILVWEVPWPTILVKRCDFKNMWYSKSSLFADSKTIIAQGHWEQQSPRHILRQVTVSFFYPVFFNKPRFRKIKLLQQSEHLELCARSTPTAKHIKQSWKLTSRTQELIFKPSQHLEINPSYT